MPVVVRLGAREPFGRTVRTPAGDPVRRARVYVWSGDGDVGEVSTLETDDAGALRAEVLPIGAIVGWQVEAAGYGGEGSAERRGAKGTDLVVRPGVTFVGRVTTETGTPVEGARVVVWPWDSRAIATTTDAKGAYRVTGVPRTSIAWELQKKQDRGEAWSQVWVEASGFATAWEDEGLESFQVGSAEIRKDFTLRRAATVRGRLSGWRSPWALSWRPETVSESSEFELLVPWGTTTGEDGSFLLVDLPPGRIVIHGPGTSVSLDLKPGEVREGIVLEAKPSK
jgi:hypothetical protein